MTISNAQNQNQQNRMQMTPFTASPGFNWSVSPALPSPFFLITNPGMDEGFVQTQDDLPLHTAGMPPTEYAVTCSQAKPDGTQFSRTRTLVIEVRTEADLLAEVQDV